MKKSDPIILTFIIAILLCPFYSLVAQSESSVDKQLFEIQRIHHAKSNKKKISVKDKKIRVTIRSDYDMGNAKLELYLNNKKANFIINEIGTESTGSKVKIVTGVIYEIFVNTDSRLKTGENELLIRGYGLDQSKKFKLKQ